MGSRGLIQRCSPSAGTIHCVFHASGNHYTWKKVTTTVHNIIVGKLWIDQVGASATCGGVGPCASVFPVTREKVHRLNLTLLPSQSGEIEIVNHKTGDKCNLKFVPYSYFSRDVARKVGRGVAGHTARPGAAPLHLGRRGHRVGRVPCPGRSPER